MPNVALYMSYRVIESNRKNWPVEAMSTVKKNFHKKPRDGYISTRKRYQTGIERSHVTGCKINLELLPEGYIETMVPFEMLEHNIIIKMTPKEKFYINVEINEIKKAKPNIIEPDWV